jgi:hypothetical protein
LQKACGNNPLSMFFMALCTSSLDAETPRSAYRLLESELILLLCSFVACPPKEDGANINIFFGFRFEIFKWDLGGCEIKKHSYKNSPIDDL